MYIVKLVISRGNYEMTTSIHLGTPVAETLQVISSIQRRASLISQRAIQDKFVELKLDSGTILRFPLYLSHL